MTQYTKPTVLPAWGESAGGVDVLQPSNAEIQAGWPLSNVPPSRKRFNWILKYLAQGVRYILQRGMPEWDAAEDYRINDRVMGSDGKTYKCIQAGINKNPTTQTAYWTRWGFTLAELDAEGTTPAQFDNSVKRASTAFVQRALGNMQGFVSINGSGSITAAQAGSDIYLNGTPGTVTLPLLSACPVGATFTIHSTTATVTLSRAGTDVIVASGSQSSLTSLKVGSGENVVLVCAGGAWHIAGGSVSLQYADMFGIAKSAQGYQKLPSGLIIQWGTASIPEGTGAVSFPIAFPTALRYVNFMAQQNNGAANGNDYYTSPSLTGFTINNWRGLTATYVWLAIGY